MPRPDLDSQPRNLDELREWAEHWSPCDDRARHTAHLFDELDAANDLLDLPAPTPTPGAAALADAMSKACAGTEWEESANQVAATLRSQAAELAACRAALHDLRQAADNYTASMSRANADRLEKATQCALRVLNAPCPPEAAT